MAPAPQGREITFETLSSHPFFPVSDFRPSLLPAPIHRFWVFSDLQQSDPDNARYCMTTGVDDFLSLRLPVDAVCYLGDSTEGIVRAHLEEMTEMQIRQLARVDAPIYYAMGNHEFDLFRYSGIPAEKREKVEVIIRDRVLRNSQWHVAASLRDWTFQTDFGDLVLFFFSDHADLAGAWCVTHGYVQDLRPGAPDPYEGDEEIAPVRDALAAIDRPFFTFSHYSFSGGNRVAPIQSRLLPLPPNAIAHFYGHSHIGDRYWGKQDVYRQISGIDNSDITQFDIASLENRRGSAVRSAILEWYGGHRYGVFFRNHTAGKWEKAFLCLEPVTRP